MTNTATVALLYVLYSMYLFTYCTCWYSFVYILLYVNESISYSKIANYTFSCALLEYKVSYIYQFKGPALYWEFSPCSACVTGVHGSTCREKKTMQSN